MAARSIWNGTLTFGTIAIPIKLFSATDSKTISFKEVRASDGARISHKRLGAQSGDEVEFKELDKAYDTGKGVVVLTKEEIAAADGSRPKLIEIESFVKGEEIDPVFYDKAYHLGANKGGDHAYRVLLEALERSGRVGIGRFVLRSREQLVALRPIQGALGLQTMRFADELVAPGDLDFPELTKKPGEKEVAMAGKLVEMLAGEWDPAAYEDTYRDAVRQLIKAKAAGEEIEPAQEKEATEGDLMAALQASLEAASKTSPSPAKARATPKRPPTKKPTGPKKSAAKAKAAAEDGD
ncbi:MAG: Ku protein [Solirubrobacteraceae bacterium]|nr:Ku protein [Solirubrobacteraceae bacterium]